MSYSMAILDAAKLSATMRSCNGDRICFICRSIATSRSVVDQSQISSPNSKSFSHQNLFM